MPTNRYGERVESGFSLTEVLIVVAIGLIVTVTAVPGMTTVIANAKMRSSMTSVSSLLQNTRMMAVHQNMTKTARNLSRPVAPFSLVYYVKTASDSSTLKTSDSQIEMEAPITSYITPTGAGAAAVIANSALGMSTSPLTGDPSFNSRGLPCSYAAGICSANVGFIKYFKDNRVSGAGRGWCAISISPAGRITRWFWNGSAWAD